MPIESLFFPSRAGRFVAAASRAMAVVLGLVFLISSAGCMSKAERQADRGVAYYLAGDYAHARDELRPISDTKDENFVLNNCRLGSSALVDYDLREAETAFLRAYEVINSVGVNDGGRSLGAVLVDEKIKIWKGEPYERAMANFYLGLTYYMEHDYANARAAFENALFKLRDYGEGDKKDPDKYRENETNFALAYLMLGRCWQKLGDADQARKAFDRAVSLQPDLSALANEQLNAQANVLLVVDYGYGPQKITAFDGAIVGLGPKPQEAGPIPLPQVVVDGRYLQLDGRTIPPVDLLALAQDRRWQSIDTIRTIKSAIGTGLIAAGAVEAGRSDNRNNQLAGLAMIGAGLFLKVTSQADVRQWEMLPRTTFVIPLRLPPGTHDLTVAFSGPNGMQQIWRGISAPANGEATYYMRMQRSTPGPYDWPPPALAQSAAAPNSASPAAAVP